MSIILNIETATHTCSVALGSDGKLLALRESHDDEYRHSEKLTEYVQDVLKDARISIDNIDAVAVSKGPGSYTGLRIGVSTAKGICFAAGKPLIAIPTLTAMVNGFIQELRKNSEIGSPAKRDGAKGAHQKPEETNYNGTLFCPMIDARRMEVFCALFDINLKQLMPTAAIIIDENSFSEYLKNNSVIFFGDGASKCRQALSKNNNAVLVSDFTLSASHMITLAEVAYKNRKFEDVAYFEPYYLKDFIAGNASSPV